MTLTQFRAKMRRLRLRGRVVCPAANATTFAPYRVTYPYGVKNNAYAAGHHTGEDHACPDGSLAVAVGWGHVLEAGATSWGPAYGTAVIIRSHDGKYDYAYCHLSAALVDPGAQVAPGVVVGHTGHTGNATGPHLHFEARPAGGHYGTDIDPIHVKQKVTTK